MLTVHPPFVKGYPNRSMDVSCGDGEQRRMILTGPEIERQVAAKRVTISPFDPGMLNPNSYNYHLAHHVRWMTDACIDAAERHIYTEVDIPEDGLVFYPDRVYLGATQEAIGSSHYVPSLIGRSSMGRLGVYLQVSADLGNLGSVHHWTLEIVVTQPTRLYAGMRVGQVSFWVPLGDISLYQGTMGQFNDATPSIPSVLDIGANGVTNDPDWTSNRERRGRAPDRDCSV